MKKFFKTALKFCIKLYNRQIILWFNVLNKTIQIHNWKELTCMLTQIDLYNQNFLFICLLYYI
jgi:hypothetical protein